MVDDWQLQGRHVNIVLSGGSYLFSLIEPPTVPETELLDALRWQLPPLEQHSAEALVIDYIKLPEQAYRGRTNRVYVAAFPKADMEQLASQMEHAGLVLNSIEIPELALAHLIQHINAHATGDFAWMHCDKDHYLLNIYGDEALYFTRRLNATGPMPTAHDVVEVKRSLDYCRNQVGCSPCQTIWLSPLMMGEVPFARQLQEDLGLTVNWLDLADWFAAEESLTPEFQQHYLLAIAGALREAS